MMALVQALTRDLLPAFSKIETGRTDINITRLEQIAGLFNASIFEILSKPSENIGAVDTK